MKVDVSGSVIGAAFTLTRWKEIEQEMLALVFACQKFHQYIYVNKVQIESDYKVNHEESNAEYTTSMAKNVPNFTKVWHRAEVFSKKENILADTLSPADLKETTENIAKELLEAQV